MKLKELKVSIKPEKLWVSYFYTRGVWYFDRVWTSRDEAQGYVNAMRQGPPHYATDEKWKAIRVLISPM